MAVAADPAALAVVGHHDHGRLVELAALVEEIEELADALVGLCQLVEVLGVAHAAHVAELVGGEQLEDEQVWVLLDDDLARGRRQRMVDALRRLHRGDRADDPVPEGVEQVRDADQAALLARALERVEDRFHSDAETGGEVGAHAVLGGGGAGEHRGEADDGAAG